MFDEVTIVGLSVLIGLLVGRWWSVVLAVPYGLLAGANVDFEGLSASEVAVLAGIGSAAGLATGVVIRKTVAVLRRTR